jgi:DNA-binding response OmpR family regulator
MPWIPGNTLAGATAREAMLPSLPARVLLAEDDRELRGLLALTLREDGYEVKEAADGAELLEALSEAGEGATFDLVITDIRMPRHTGIDVLSRLRWTDGELPVILITAFGEERTHQLAERLGAAAVFDKPFDLDDLRVAVTHTLFARGRAL